MSRSCPLGRPALPKLLVALRIAGPAGGLTRERLPCAGSFIAEEGQFVKDEWAGDAMCTVEQARAAAAEADIAAQMARVFEVGVGTCCTHHSTHSLAVSEMQSPPPGAGAQCPDGGSWGGSQGGSHQGSNHQVEGCAHERRCFEWPGGRSAARQWPSSSAMERAASSLQ